VKEIRITLSDDQYARADAGKDGRTWREAIMEEIAVDQLEVEE
jgi:hypothetical protein